MSVLITAQFLSRVLLRHSALSRKPISDSYQIKRETESGPDFVRFKSESYSHHVTVKPEPDISAEPCVNISQPELSSVKQETGEKQLIIYYIYILNRGLSNTLDI